MVSFFGKIFSRNSAHVDQFLATKIQFMMDNFGPQTHTHTDGRRTHSKSFIQWTPRVRGTR